MPEKVIDLASWEQKCFQLGRNPQAPTTWRSNSFDAPHQVIGKVNSRQACRQALGHGGEQGRWGSCHRMEELSVLTCVPSS